MVKHGEKNCISFQTKWKDEKEQMLISFSSYLDAHSLDDFLPLSNLSTEPNEHCHVRKRLHSQYDCILFSQMLSDVRKSYNFHSKKIQEKKTKNFFSISTECGFVALGKCLDAFAVHSWEIADFNHLLVEKKENNNEI